MTTTTATPATRKITRAGAKAAAKGKAKTPAPKGKATPKDAPIKLTPAERTAKRIADEDAIRAKGGVVRNAAGRPTARRLPCLCGCGTKTHRDEAWFNSGHDAILRKAVIEGGATLKAVPEIARPFFELGSPIAGLLLEDGKLLDVKGR